jgi:hypothetical protein
MTPEQLEQLTLGLAPVFVEEIAAAITPMDLRLRALEELGGTLIALVARVKAMEDRAPVPGPAGVAGPSGRDGRDGFNLDDFSAEFDGERTVTVKFIRGELVKVATFTIAAPLYRGVYEDGRSYVKGDAVTWGGHLWIAKEATTERPGVTPAASHAWQLAVKAGRDGREGKPGRPA